MVRRRSRIDKSKLTIGIPERIRDEQHRRFIASLPCLCCGVMGTTQAAHIRSGHSGGMALKPGDDLTIPLCVSCHLVQGKDEVGFHGDIERVKALGRELYAIKRDGLRALQLLAAYRRG